MFKYLNEEQFEMYCMELSVPALEKIIKHEFDAMTDVERVIIFDVLERKKYGETSDEAYENWVANNL